MMFRHNLIQLDIFVEHSGTLPQSPNDYYYYIGALFRGGLGTISIDNAIDKYMIHIFEIYLSIIFIVVFSDVVSTKIYA